MTSGLEGVRGLVEEIAHQKPEKPDYWNSCSQCERNIDAAQEALATLHTRPADAEYDRELIAEMLEQYRDSHEDSPGAFLAESIDAQIEKLRAADNASARGYTVSRKPDDAEVLELPINDAVPAPTQIEPGNLFLWNWRAMQEYARTCVAHSLSQQPEARGVVDEVRSERAWPAIGNLYLVKIGGVLQHEVFMFDQGDCEPGGSAPPFWSRDGLDDCPEFDPHKDQWISLDEIDAALTGERNG